METIILNGGWQVRAEEFGTIGEGGLAEVARHEGGWLAAEVPGEIHLDLMRTGQMPDPSVSTHMPDCRWPETKSWWYRTTFAVDEVFTAHERQRLVFEGLDLFAQVFVNGRLIGEAANAFVPAVFDVRGSVRAGENELVVRLTAGSELAKDAAPHPEQRLASNGDLPAPGEIPNPMQPGDITGHRLWGGRKWLRKPQFSYGWDWVDALPNIGIWRGVRLEAGTGTVLRDLRLDTRQEGGRTRLELEAVLENLHPWSERACELVVEIRPPDGGQPIRRAYRLLAQPGLNPLEDSFDVPAAQLWWPNGMGAQPLYTVAATVRDAAGQVDDRREFAIGLRTVEIDRSPLPEGSRFCIRVNGQDVFCRGVNIGPHDAILARISDEKYETLVAEARDAHLNMIRINGCSIYEAPAFYDACDRAGILVWQDFMLTVANYPAGDREFFERVRLEAEAVVPLLRHHPSIALWCGDNETVWVFAEYARRYATPVNTLGIEFPTTVFPEVCHRLDPRRPYWLSCPAGGEYPNSELEGDCHWWWPAFMHPEMERRIRHEIFDECRARFVSEYGVLGPCHLDFDPRVPGARRASPRQRRLAAAHQHVREGDHAGRHPPALRRAGGAERAGVRDLRANVPGDDARARDGGAALPQGRPAG